MEKVNPAFELLIPAKNVSKKFDTAPRYPEGQESIKKITDADWQSTNTLPEKTGECRRKMTAVAIFHPYFAEAVKVNQQTDQQ